MKSQLILPAVLALALGGAIGPLSSSSALAQAPSPPPAGAPQQPGPAPQAQRPQRTFHSHIAGRIAYLKAELKITPEQNAAFDKVAQAMRDDAADMQKSFQDRRAARGQTHTAVDRLNARIQMGQLHVREEQRYLAAFKPLYDSLSDDQKKAADQLAAPRHFGARPGMRPGMRPQN